MKKKTKRRGGAFRARYARGNMDVTAALIRCALACSAFIVLAGALSVSGLSARMPGWASLLLQTGLTLLCFLLPAVHGLFVADGDQRGKLCRQALGPGQMRWLAITGVLLVCPMTLLSDLIAALLARFGFSAAAASAPPFVLFLPMVLKSVLLAPVCEELFFRGYFFAALKEAAGKGALAITSLFFALVHGVDAALLPRFALGLLLGALMERTDSLLAPMLVHAAYNLTLLVLSFAGLGGLFSGLGFASCLIRVLGCAALSYALQEAYLARGARRTFEWGGRLTIREQLLVAFAAIALAYAPVFLAMM